MKIRRSNKRAEEFFKKNNQFELDGEPISHEEFYFLMALDYEKLHSLENASFTPTFWRWYKHVMIDIYENLFDGIKTIPVGSCASDFFDHEFRCRPVPPMIYNKIISEYVNTPKFKQIQAEEQKYHAKKEKSLKTKLKAV